MRGRLLRGLGLTGSLREALAVETPVIGTGHRGQPRAHQGRRDRLPLCPRDIDALARSILRMVEDPERARAMARAGRKRVEAEFSMTAKIDRTEALYRRLLGAKRSA